jgi:hypothetical protein
MKNAPAAQNATALPGLRLSPPNLCLVANQGVARTTDEILCAGTVAAKGASANYSYQIKYEEN